MGRAILYFSLVLATNLATCTILFDRNHAYRSPFTEHPHLSHDTKSIHRRTAGHVRRQMQDAMEFDDKHYPGFYGSDFSNSPFVWNGGLNFTHSVASGDPFDTSIILWTRAIPVSPDGTSELPDQSVPACVSFKVATSSDFSGPAVSTGEAFTSYDVDWTVKVEATGLTPDTKYFYQFSDCTHPKSVSSIGTTRTIASPDTDADQVNGGKPLTFAVFSCSQYQNGWFNAYGVAAQNTSADIFLHLGDYIYESVGSGAGIGRAVLGRTLATIFDYRQRLNQYRTDPNLRVAHQIAPWITVWDDHEVADNAWKAGTTTSNDTGAGCKWSPSGACFTDRKMAAVRAYHEWMPIRQVDAADQLRIWRNFKIGKLMDLTMLDTREYDRDITSVGYNSAVVKAVVDFENRSIMGATQEKWFYDTLSESKNRDAVWRVVGQQVVFTQLLRKGSFSLDAWDAYRANRRRILDHLYGNQISNTVILAGDSHANWVSDLAYPNDTLNYNPDSGVGAIGVEFAGTAVTSSSSFGAGILPDAADAMSRTLVDVNEDLQWSEGSFRGFFTLTIDTHTLNATYYAMQNTSFANLDGFASAKFVVEAGQNKLSRPVAGGSVGAGVLKSQVKVGGQ
ncbi:PhoD-like phosphatase-domain-containing protein [Crucibulum laeve]|uniref:PhoD-like phosphatase-domain-containing protein n=1 Tax=Crucibulum laeve TaxID=68775 RepID=A0A5C3LZ39_9AGAR|nr:PhoD-like phosphatase-domain-containing protein [Crucibulum laeve]